MRRVIVIINPNSSEKTTEMMVELARRYLAGSYEVEGVTAVRSPRMIVTEAALSASVAEVVEMGEKCAARSEVAGMVVAAFGDPGLGELRGKTTLPVTGLCEASMKEAGSGGRRFGVATTTPGLIEAIECKAKALGYDGVFTGVRVPGEDPLKLADNPELTESLLAKAVETCAVSDGAEAVIIGGGPLGRAAAALSRRFSLPVIGPVPAACKALAEELRRRQGF